MAEGKNASKVEKCVAEPLLKPYLFWSWSSALAFLSLLVLLWLLLAFFLLLTLLSSWLGAVIRGSAEYLVQGF